jgi:PTS system mannose-specific IIB component/fructoselysine and glucoselysine-specific PTS system IIB component
MAILLCRVDDRLIHGQVVVGWGSQLGLDFLVVVDDELSASEWEQDLYRAGLPDDIEARFPDVEAAIREFPDWKASAQRGFVLTRDLATMRRLAEGGALAEVEINIGGLHDAPGRRRILPYLFLGDEDREELLRFQRAGSAVSAQDLPGARKIKLEELLNLASG